MAILWCGTEEIDFPITGGTITANTSSNYHPANIRAAVSYSSLNAGATSLESLPFTTLTSGWFTANWYTSGSLMSARAEVGLGKAGTLAGVFIGRDSGNPPKFTIFKVDSAGTVTQVGIEDSATFSPNVLIRLDVRITNFGSASGHVTLYINNTIHIDVDCDLTSDVADLDCFRVRSPSTVVTQYISQVIVADEDTRVLTMAVLNPSGAGDTNGWTGTYADIDEVILNDSDIISAETTDLEIKVATADIPAGSFLVKAVKDVWRGSAGASGVSQIIPGVQTNGSTHYGTAKTHTTAWETGERLMLQNPVTSNIWQVDDLNSAQLCFKVGT